MGFFGDMAKSLLFGDNNYAYNVTVEYNLDTYYGLIQAIDDTVKLTTHSPLENLPKSQGYRKGIIDHIKMLYNENRSYSSVISKALSYCKRTKTKGDDYHRQAYEWFEINLQRILDS